MKSTNWPAPAKINLFLHIIGRRDDGYHILQTVFQFLDYCDYLDFEITNDRTISRTSIIEGVSEESDLIVKAAKLLQERSGTEFGVNMEIRKSIPMQGGLGGGSSDAATTLVALNYLWKLDYSADVLLELGLQLGADVPVFIQGKATFAEGVGEQFTPIEPAEAWLLVVRPDCEISTAEIFNAEDLTRNTPPITIRDFLRDGGHNDCLAAVKKRYPEVVEAMTWLAQYSEPKLTGTGSCIFAEFVGQEMAEQALEELPKRWHGIACRTMNDSPLLERLALAKQGK